MKNITYAWKENRGERKYREDSVSVSGKDGHWLFVLADGLGGMGYGAVASRTAVEAAVAAFHEHKEHNADGNVLIRAVEAAQEAVLRCQKEKPEYRDMATTITALEIDGDTARWIHIGDSRIYFFRDGRFKTRSKDHSVPQMLANAGMIREEEIRVHPDRSRLLRAVGQDWRGAEVWVLSAEAVRLGQGRGMDNFSEICVWVHD